MTMPASIPPIAYVSFGCPVSPAPQTGSGVAWTNETGLGSGADFNAATASWVPASELASKGLIAEADSTADAFDADRYELVSITLTVDAFSSAALPAGSILRVEFGSYSGGSWSGVGNAHEIDISPTGTDISVTSNFAASLDPAALSITTPAVITHARFTVTLATSATVDVGLDQVTAQFVMLPRVGWAPKPRDVYSHPKRAANGYRRMAEAAGRSLVLLVGDSTTNHRGFGFEEGLQVGLTTNGIPKWSTGIAQHGDNAGTANNSTLGTGEQFLTHSCQDFTTSPALASWDELAGTRPFSRQKITYSGSAGNFRLRHNGYTNSAGTHTAATTDTADIAHNASAATIASAIQTAIGGNVRGTGGPLGTAPVVIEFYGATWAPLTLDLMTVRAPGSGSAITPTVAIVEYWLGTGFPAGIRATVAATAVGSALTIRQNDDDLALDATYDVELATGLNPSDALTAHHVYWGGPTTGTARANLRKSADGNEAQSVTIDAAGGTFTLAVPGATGDAMDPIAYDTSAASLQAALRTHYGASTINVYSPFSYRRRGYYITLTPELAAAELLLNATGLTPGVCDYGCERVGQRTWHIWHTATGGTLTIGWTGGAVGTGALAYDTSTADMQTAIRAAFDSSATVSGYVRTNFYVYWSDAAAKSLMTVNGGALTESDDRAKSAGVKRINGGGAGYAEYATTNLNTTPASEQAVEATIALSASARTAAIDSQWSSGGGNTTAPFLHLGQWVERPATTTGYGLWAILGKGGRGLRLYAESLGLVSATWAASTLGKWYDNAVSASADGLVDVLIQVHSGVNDLNDSTNSLGPSPAAGNTRAGISDNCAAVKTAMDAILTAAGIPTDRRWYEFMPSLPVDPANTTLSFVRLGMEDAVASWTNAWVTRADELCRDFNEAHRGYVVASYPYTDTTPGVNDRNHHLRGWYRTIGTRMVAAGLLASEQFPNDTSRQFRVRAPRGGRI